MNILSFSKTLIIASLLCIALSHCAVAQSNTTFKLFPDILRNSVPEELIKFTENYVNRVSDMDNRERAKRLNFDEVEISFPLTPKGINDLQEANQLSLDLIFGKYYKISWIKDDQELGSFSFPANYNLIKETDQDKSFQELKQKFSELANNGKGEAEETISITDFNPNNIVTIEGDTFYLGHLSSNTYIDILSRKPIWNTEYPAESLANLFILGPEVSDPVVNLEMEGYDREVYKTELPFHSLYEVLKAEGNQPFYGVSEKSDDGSIESFVVFFNPLYAFIHSLTVVYSGQEDNNDNAVINVKLLPFIKLHNLKNLWSEFE